MFAKFLRSRIDISLCFEQGAPLVHPSGFEAGEVLELLLGTETVVRGWLCKPCLSGVVYSTDQPRLPGASTGKQ